MKNKMQDLENHLFMQLERLGEEGLTEKNIDKEVKRAEALVKISDQLTTISGQKLKAVDLVGKYGQHLTKDLPMLAHQTDENLT